MSYEFSNKCPICKTEMSFTRQLCGKTYCINEIFLESDNDVEDSDHECDSDSYSVLSEETVDGGITLLEEETISTTEKVKSDEINRKRKRINTDFDLIDSLVSEIEEVNDQFEKNKIHRLVYGGIIGNKCDDIVDKINDIKEKSDEDTVKEDEEEDMEYKNLAMIKCKQIHSIIEDLRNKIPEIKK